MIVSWDTLRSRAKELSNVLAEHNLAEDKEILHAKIAIHVNAIRDALYMEELSFYPEDVKKLRGAIKKYFPSPEAFAKDAIAERSIRGEEDDWFEYTALDEAVGLFDDFLEDVAIGGICRCRENPPRKSFVGKYSETAKKRISNIMFSDAENEEL